MLTISDVMKKWARDDALRVVCSKGKEVTDATRLDNYQLFNGDYLNRIGKKTIDGGRTDHKCFMGTDETDKQLERSINWQLFFLADWQSMIASMNWWWVVRQLCWIKQSDLMVTHIRDLMENEWDVPSLSINNVWNMYYDGGMMRYEND